MRQVKPAAADSRFFVRAIQFSLLLHGLLLFFLANARMNPSSELKPDQPERRYLEITLRHEVPVKPEPASAAGEENPSETEAATAANTPPQAEKESIVATTRAMCSR